MLYLIRENSINLFSHRLISLGVREMNSTKPLGPLDNRAIQTPQFTYNFHWEKWQLYQQSNTGIINGIV